MLCCAVLAGGRCLILLANVRHVAQINPGGESPAVADAKPGRGPMQSPAVGRCKARLWAAAPHERARHLLLEMPSSSWTIAWYVHCASSGVTGSSRRSTISTSGCGSAVRNANLHEYSSE